jgi:hypothetical protein
MHGFAYCAALLVAAVFLRAAVAKLADRTGTRAAFRTLGLPPSTATVVPAIELVLVLTLVVAPGWGAALALALLAAFTTFLALAVRAGVQGGCNCFGNARRAPVSWIELLRNGLLAAIALIAIAASKPTVPDPGAVATVLGAAVLATGVLRMAEATR